MATRIETTVGNAARDLAETGMPQGRRVIMAILDEDDEARLRDLRTAVAEGENSGDLIDGDEVLDDLRRNLERKFPGRT